MEIPLMQLWDDCSAKAFLPSPLLLCGYYLIIISLFRKQFHFHLNSSEFKFHLNSDGMCAKTVTEGSFGILVINLTLSQGLKTIKQLKFLDRGSKLKGCEKTVVALTFTLPGSRLIHGGQKDPWLAPRSWHLQSPVVLSSLHSHRHALQPVPERPCSERSVPCPLR